MAHFLIHEALFENIEEVKDIIKAQNDSFTDMSNFKPIFHRDSIEDTVRNIRMMHNVVIPFLPIGLYRKIKPVLNLGADDSFFSFSNTLSMFRNYMLNSDGVFLPYRCLYSPVSSVVSNMGEKIFIRPDSGNKSFSGQVIDNTEESIRQFKRTTRIDDREMVFITQNKDVGSEIRVFLYDDIISSSFYEHADSPQKSIEINNAIKNICENMVVMIKENCGLYEFIVADFTILPNGEIKLVEINNAYTSGFYKADVGKILQKSKTIFSDSILKI